MNLYAPNPLLDSPFGSGDLEWLYRQQDVDGNSLTSRLAQLAPVSFTNSHRRPAAAAALRARHLGDQQLRLGQRQPGRRLPDQQPVHGQHATPASRATSGTSARASADTPSLAHRDKKINLNYPLPVSNDPNEPIRQKWISDTYQTAQGDPAAQGGRHARGAGAAQPVRDQHHRLPRPRLHDDPLAQPGREAGAGDASPAARSTARATWRSINHSRKCHPATNTAIPLDQYGMEYNPIAINEALAYSFASRHRDRADRTASSSSW